MTLYVFEIPAESINRLISIQIIDCAIGYCDKF